MKFAPFPVLVSIMTMVGASCMSDAQAVVAKRKIEAPRGTRKQNSTIPQIRPVMSRRTRMSLSAIESLRASDRKMRSGFRINQTLKQIDRAPERCRLNARRSNDIKRTRCVSDLEGGAPSHETISAALLEPPNSATTNVLKDYGLLVIEGVPPIFALFPDEKEEIETGKF